MGGLELEVVTRPGSSVRCFFLIVILSEDEKSDVKHSLEERGRKTESEYQDFSLRSK
jgi:hypothetical protein